MRTFRALAICLVLLSPFAFTHAQQPSTGSSDGPADLPAGISLPRTGTAFAIDARANGPELLKLHGEEIVNNSHAAGNVARNMVYVGSRASVEINGLTSSINLSSSSPTFYIRVAMDDAEIFRDRLHLIHLSQGKDRRVVAGYSQNIFGGQRAKHYEDVQIEKALADAGAWVTVKPSKLLPPGEYGIVIMPKDANLFPDVVYDFNIGTLGPKK